MPDGHFSTNNMSPNTAADWLTSRRMDLRGQIIELLEKFDSSNPDTLQFAVAGMLETHYKPKDLSAILGPSQTTIGRWALGQTIPRSPPYRKWLVETLIAYLKENQPMSQDVTIPDQKTPIRPRQPQRAVSPKPTPKRR